jgi:hypothetical protein
VIGSGDLFPKRLRSRARGKPDGLREDSGLASGSLFRGHVRLGGGICPQKNDSQLRRTADDRRGVIANGRSYASRQRSALENPSGCPRLHGSEE